MNSTDLEQPNSTITTDSKKKSYFDYPYTKGVVEFLIGGAEKVKSDVRINRQLRYFRDIRGEILRSGGILKADEGYYPIKLIDTKIRREQPQYISYLTQSRRACIFEKPDGSEFPNSAILERDFTNKFRFLRWEIPFIQWIDGCQGHGWDVVEVVFTQRTPGHFAFEHCGRENLILADDLEDIEAQEIIPRRITLTNFELESLVESHGFDPAQVNQLIAINPDRKSQYNINNFQIFKLFFKEDGIVYVGYYSRQASNWLKVPEPLYLGRHDLEAGQQPILDADGNQQLDPAGNPLTDFPKLHETEYPFIMLPYIVSEDHTIAQIKGRCQLDEAYQEAATVVNTSIVNKTARASNLYATPEAIPGNVAPSAEPKQLDVVLANGLIWDRPLKFAYLPAVTDPEIKVVQHEMTMSDQETSNINYTALTRQDTEKTATEIMSAQQEASKLSSVQVTLLSIALRLCATKAFDIYQNRAAMGKIIVPEAVKPLLYTLDPSGKIILNLYTIKSAGDIDVVQKAEYLDRRMKFWGFVKEVVGLGPNLFMNPFALEYVKDLIQQAFPEDSVRYINSLEKGNQAVTIIQRMTSLIQELAIDPKTNKPRPEVAQFVPVISGLLQQAQMMVNPGQQPQTK